MFHVFQTLFTLKNLPVQYEDSIKLINCVNLFMLV